MLKNFITVYDFILIKDVDDLEKPAISLHRGMLQEERRNKTDQLETENFSKSESDSDEREGKIIY